MLFTLIKKICCWNRYSILPNNVDIPICLQEIGCFTLEDLANMIITGFYDYKSININIAIKYFKHYLNKNYSSNFNGGTVLLSLPHKTDPWNSLSSNGKYLVAGNMFKNFCHSRWLIRVHKNDIFFVDQFHNNIDVSPNLIKESSILLENYM